MRNLFSGDHRPETMKRRDLMALLKTGFSATVSHRALVILAPIERSLAQCGTSPNAVGRNRSDLILTDGLDLLCRAVVVPLLSND